MTKAVLSQKFKTLATQGNFNNQVGVPLTLFRLKHTDEVAVVEMGTSGPNEIRPLSNATEPDFAIITNIGASHLEGLGSLEGVFREKMNIVSGLKKGGTLFVNADDPLLSKVRSTKNYKVKTFGIRRGILRPENLEFDEKACASFRIGRTQFHLDVPGIHNVYNALAAISVGISFRIPKAEIAKALEKFSSTGMRMEIRTARGFKIVSDCYNANPSSTKMALQTVGSFNAANRRIAVLGDMLELGEFSEKLHREIGEMLPESNFDYVFTFGNLSKKISEGALAKGMRKERTKHFDSLRELLVALSETVALGDVILVKGSRGMHLERVVEALSLMDGVGV